LWQAPPTGIYKINRDAAIYLKNGRINAGIIARNF
jgi:hypothetical protein